MQARCDRMFSLCWYYSCEVVFLTRFLHTDTDIDALGASMAMDTSADITILQRPWHCAVPIYRRPCKPPASSSAPGIVWHSHARDRGLLADSFSSPCLADPTWTQLQIGTHLSTGSASPTGPAPSRPLPVGTRAHDWSPRLPRTLVCPPLTALASSSVWPKTLIYYVFDPVLVCCTSC